MDGRGAARQGTIMRRLPRRPLLGALAASVCAGTAQAQGWFAAVDTLGFTPRYEDEDAEDDA